MAIDVRDGRAAAMSRFVALKSPPLLSIFTRIELEGGVHTRAAAAATRRRRLDALLSEAETLPFDMGVIGIYGRIVEARGFSRRQVLDRLIAATAILHDLTLVILNGVDFRAIPDLRLEVWSAQ